MAQIPAGLEGKFYRGAGRAVRKVQPLSPSEDDHRRLTADFVDLGGHEDSMILRMGLWHRLRDIFDSSPDQIARRTMKRKMFVMLTASGVIRSGMNGPPR